MCNDLIYYIQTNFSVLEVEEIHEWIITEKFYFYMICQLCVINYLLINHIILLENIIVNNENYEIHEFHEVYGYIGKELNYCNKGILSELNILLFIDKYKKMNYNP